MLALAAGLAVVVVGRDRPLLRLAIDGFIVGVVPTLVAAHVLPYLWDQLGVGALGLIALGYGAFWLIEHVAEHQAIHSRVVVSVLALHSLVDGASLAMAQRLELGRASAVLMAVLVIHRFPEGLVIGAFLIPRYGLRAGAAGAALLAVMTLAGAAGGHELLQRVEGGGLNLAIACGVGALLRTVLHGHGTSRLRAAPALLGAAFGAAMALGLPELP